MEDLPRQTNLLRRNGHYYIRVRVPLDLIEHLSKKEIKVSLKTQNIHQAKLKLAIEQLKIQQLFTEARRNLQLRQHPPHQVTNSLTKEEIERIILLWHQQYDYETGKNDDHLRTTLGDSEIRDIIATQYDELTVLQNHEERAHAGPIQSVTQKIFNARKIDIDAQSNELKQYAYNIVKQASIEQAFSSLKRFGQPVNRTPFTLFSTTAPYPHPSAPQNTSDYISLKKVLSKFKEAKINEGMQAKTLAGYKLTFDFLIELFGANRNIKDITVEDCRTYRDQLSLLPSNARKKYPTLSLMESIKKHPERSTDRLSATSVNNNLKNLSTLFNFAVGDGYIDKNPVQRVKAKANKLSQPRVPFDEKHLINLFNTPIYRGCIDDNSNYKKAGKSHPRRHRFWIPLIGLWTGMRLNEICQLFTTDITQIDGINVIQIKEDKDGLKKLKTVQSQRTIPIHNALLMAGLMDYVEDMKNKGNHYLFPDLTISRSKTNSDSRSAAFSKWFNHFLISSNIKEEGLCFHSFRHGFRDACRHADIHEEIVEALGGWKNSDKVMNTYGKGHRLKKLQEEINKIEFDGLNLNHLKMKK